MQALRQGQLHWQATYQTLDALPRVRGWYAARLQISPASEQYLTGGDFSEPVVIESQREAGMTLSIQIVPFGVERIRQSGVWGYIDAYYQSAAGHLTGAGGWPLTCFTTSTGALFFAAGYVPPRPGTGV